jgi:proton-dependent oligopeptide transporter, POT family
MTMMQHATSATMAEAEIIEQPLVDSDLDSSGLGGHPAGLTTLFFTELWERFSYYGMRAILMLYMVAPTAEGGLGFPIEKAASIYGTYTMLVYMASIPGGWVADRLIGGRLSVLIGGIIIALGHFTLVFQQLPFFYAGLCLIVVGTGLLKPNVSSMLGSLYSQGDNRRDGGFSIFYMGINIGAALAPLVCGYLAQSGQFKSWLVSVGLEPASSWHWGFGAAGVGMALGLAHYLLQQKRLGNAGLRPQAKQKKKKDEHVEKQPLTAAEWKRLGAIGVLFFFATMFWAVYEQGGSSLSLFADKLTDCTIFGWNFPSSWFQSLQAVFVIALAPLFSLLWLRLGKREPSSPAKFTYGLLFLGLGIALMVPASLAAQTGKVSLWWLTAVYFLQVVGELCLSPVGLSTVTKLAPLRMVGMIMGVWFLASSLGNKLAGYLGGFFNDKDLSSLTNLYGGMAGAVLLATAILFALTPTVRKLMGGIR